MTQLAHVPMLVLALAAAMTFSAQATAGPADPDKSVIQRAQLWRPTSIADMDLKKGPQGPGAFPFRAKVVCDYLDKKLEGHSPKFACALGKKDDVKVKFGAANGEVYGEVLATRLLWALGFGADRMYPVTVICRGCPADLGGIERPGGESRFDPAVIERKMPGKEWKAKGREEGWSWKELESVDSEAGGAPRAHRDALKLLAVFIQHTDNKPQQQRVLCRDADSNGKSHSCGRPFLMINDLGLTFGRASRSNANATGGANLAAWRQMRIWKHESGCVGNLPKSFSGTLADPPISEEGRRFLAELLAQLSERQIEDLFEVARVELRYRSPGDPSSGRATMAEWVQAFEEKRAQVSGRRCTTS